MKTHFRASQPRASLSRARIHVFSPPLPRALALHPPSPSPSPPPPTFSPRLPRAVSTAPTRPLSPPPSAPAPRRAARHRLHHLSPRVSLARVHPLVHHRLAHSLARAHPSTRTSPRSRADPSSRLHRPDPTRTSPRTRTRTLSLSPSRPRSSSSSAAAAASLPPRPPRAAFSTHPPVINQSITQSITIPSPRGTRKRDTQMGFTKPRVRDDGSDARTRSRDTPTGPDPRKKPPSYRMSDIFFFCPFRPSRPAVSRLFAPPPLAPVPRPDARGRGGALARVAPPSLSARSTRLKRCSRCPPP